MLPSTLSVSLVSSLCCLGGLLQTRPHLTLQPYPSLPSLPADTLISYFQRRQNPFLSTSCYKTHLHNLHNFSPSFVKEVPGLLIAVLSTCVLDPCLSRSGLAPSKSAVLSSPKVSTPWPQAPSQFLEKGNFFPVLGLVLVPVSEMVFPPLSPGLATFHLSHFHFLCKCFCNSLRRCLFTLIDSILVPHWFLSQQ